MIRWNHSLGVLCILCRYSMYVFYVCILCMYSMYKSLGEIQYVKTLMIHHEHVRNKVLHI